MHKLFIMSFILLNFLISINVNAQMRIDQWNYIQVDSSRQKWGDWNKPDWLRYFGFDARDITGDGFKDIVAGRYFYRNPGGNMTGEWERTDFGINVDGMLFVDVDGDKYGDVIAQALPNVYWLEAEDMLGRSWQIYKIAELAPTKHVNGQGYKIAQIIDGGKPEIVFTTTEGVFYIEIPEENLIAPWKTVRMTSGTMDEGVGIGDMNGDGHLDVVAGVEIKVKETYRLMLYENPGDGSADWKGRTITKDVMVPDRIVIADFNGDQLKDVAVSEERSPGKEPNANLNWYEHPTDSKQENWERHTVTTSWSMNNLDAV